MRVYKTVTVETQQCQDVTCDCCGESMISEIGNINGVSVRGSGAYDSTHFMDGDEIDADVCEKCTMAWFKGFKHNPVTNTLWGTPTEESNVEGFPTSEST